VHFFIFHRTDILPFKVSKRLSNVNVHLIKYFINHFQLYSAFPFKTRRSFFRVIHCHLSSHTQIKYIPAQVRWSYKDYLKNEHCYTVVSGILVFVLMFKKDNISGENEISSDAFYSFLSSLVLHAVHREQKEGGAKRRQNRLE